MSFAGKGDKWQKIHKQLKDDFTYIPSGTALIDNENLDVQGFFMSQAEVSNAQYKSFLKAYRETHTEEESSIMEIDSTGWMRESSYGEPFVGTYHTHPAYADYPVLNISREGALAYCAWLEASLNAGSEGIMHYTVRLPNRNEWIHAAQAGGQAPYSWGGYYVRNAKGCILANFNRIGTESVHYNEDTEEYELVKAAVPNALNNSYITAPVRSYHPNANGLYNMNGNVAEMVAEEGIAVGGGWNSTGYDIRNESIMTFEGSSKYVGFRPIVSFTK